MTARAKWVRRIVVVLLVLGALSLVALLANRPTIFLYLLVASGAFFIAASEIAFPGFSVALVLLMAPFVFAVYDVHYNRETWRTWQFWLSAALCEGMGGFALLRLTRRYRKRDQ